MLSENQRKKARESVRKGRKESAAKHRDGVLEVLSALNDAYETEKKADDNYESWLDKWCVDQHVVASSCAPFFSNKLTKPCGYFPFSQQ